MKAIDYKLLTPGPLTTSENVKREMLVDHCTWDDDYKEVTLWVRKKLLELAEADEKNYTAVLMQGSGTFGVESVLTSVVGKEDHLLIAANGSYGQRMEEIANHAGINHTLYETQYDQIPDPQAISGLLQKYPEITHVSMVHCETTSGIINDIKAVSKVVKEAGRTMIVDAMSSFGGVEIPVEQWGIDFLISSANKCIQGVPGFSFMICNREALEASKGKARSLSLDLYDQWESMEADGKWRYTSPTHVVLAFAKAIEELEEEGGIAARNKRYKENNRILMKGLKELGFQPYVNQVHQSPIITTFFYPEHKNYSFQEMYSYIKERGYAIYPGKVTSADTFRVGNIGEIYSEDMEKLCSIMKEFLEEKEK
jgi:2-aminoethylphosphonate-pyruvate transaminase